MKNMKLAAYRAPSLLESLKRQKPSKKRDVLIDILETWSEAREIVDGVEDASGTPGSPCGQQSGAAVLKLRTIFGIPRKKTVMDTAEVQTNESSSASPTLSCGPGPYCVKIVNSRNFYEAIWAGPHVYKTENDAVRAVIRKAVREENATNRWKVDKDCIRHWVTERREHVIDFGSHSYYGLVTGRETI